MTNLVVIARRTVLGLWSLAVLGLCSCSDLLDVDAPDRVEASELDNPQNEGFLVRGVVAEFECAFSAYVLAGGLLGDEMADGGGNSAMWHYDRRTIRASDDGPYARARCDEEDPGVYTTLSVARFQADNAIQLLNTFTDAQVANRLELLATANAYAGYSYLLLGEAMCEAGIDGGAALSSGELLGVAEARFGEAITHATAVGRDDILNMARVGRARTRLDQGRGAEAVADAEQVPPGFRFEALYSDASERSSNKVWTFSNRDARAVVEDDYRSVQFAGTPDPRVIVENTGTLRQDAFEELWIQTKYPTQSSPIPIARAEEAQLIIAEVRGGQEAVTIINNLHTAVGLPAFSSSDPAEIQAQVIQERRAELFLESHHFFDARRLGPPVTPPEGTEFPHKGGQYGPLTCLPLPDIERNNNPNIP